MKKTKLEYLSLVIPANAGIQYLVISPSATTLDAGFHRHDGLGLTYVRFELPRVGECSVLNFALRNH
jgi:hypothetical protein